MAKGTVTQQIKYLTRKLSSLETDYAKNNKAFLKRERILKKAKQVQDRLDLLKQEVNTK